MRKLLLLVVVALVSSAGAAPRAGKVVRVARKPRGISGVPRYCTISPSDMFGQCIGTVAPEVGDRMLVVDMNHVLGTMRVTNVQAYNDGCQAPYSWMIQGVAESGDFSNSRGIAVGVSDVPIDMRNAKVISPDRSPTGHQWGTDTIYAIDNNADNQPDVEFIQYTCDDYGTVSPNGTSTCHDVWAVQGNRGLERLRSDRFRICY